MLSNLIRTDNGAFESAMLFTKTSEISMKRIDPLRSNRCNLILILDIIPRLNGHNYDYYWILYLSINERGFHHCCYVKTPDI